MRTLFSVQLVACAALGLAAGCGGKPPANATPTVEVTGLVMVDGAPGDGISVTCVPASAQLDFSDPSATRIGAQTAPDGKFSLSLFPDKPGIPVGDYALTFVWLKMIDSPNSALSDKDFLLKRYSTVARSPKKFSVKEGPPIDLGTIELSTKKK